MIDIHKKLEDYLSEKNNDEYFPEADVDMMDRMVDFILDLDSEKLSEDQKDEVVEIIDTIADNKIEGMDEAIGAKKVKINPTERRERKRQYRKNKAQLKLKAKKFRRTSKYKQWKRKKDRKAGQGKTATGKRIRKFL